MAKPISILTKVANVSEFDKVPRRLYSEDAPPLKRVFDIAEKWLIVDGEVSFKDELTSKSLTGKTGDVLVLPENSAFSNMRFTQPTYVKQYIDNANERTRISTNIRINYLIIQTILEICNQFEDFISVPFDNLDLLFKSAKEGSLYEYAVDYDWHTIDEIIQNFVGRTEINENVWYGKTRLKTGLKYDKSGWDNSLSIDFIDDIANGTEKQQTEAYNLMKTDPLDLKSQGIIVSKESLYTLENLLIFVARAIKEEEQGLLNNTFPSDIKLRQPRNSNDFLQAGMPPKLLYGNTLATVIKHLFWANSVGFHNRLKL